MSRFYPPSGGSDFTFGLYVVSGMLKNGSLIVSWSTGAPATQQIDYGINDESVPNQTPIPVDDEGQRIYSVFHEVAFPSVFVGTDHYFRVRSESREGQVLVSPIYSVYVTDTLLRTSQTIKGEIALALAPIDHTATVTQPLNAQTNGRAKFSDVQVQGATTQAQQRIQSIDKQLDPGDSQQTVMETNYNISIE